MGTNLSQVFISNTANFQATAGENNTDLFTNLSTAEVGVWNVPGIVNGTGTNYWVATKLFEKTFAITDTAGAGGSVNFANPSWKYNRIQFAQGTAGNPIATPIINTANIKRIKFDPYLAAAGHKTVIDIGTALNSKNATFKFVIRTTPTDYLSFYDQNGSGLTDLSGAGYQFPLGAFNTTNHKVISVESLFAARPTNDEAGLYDHLVTIIAANEILNALFKVTDGATNCTIEARHPGVIFDLIISNDTDGTELASSVQTVTGFVAGVGNPWQVLGEEIRCRSRYGNFNRMYLPQNMPTYTNSTYQYHKVTIEYATNWPTSTGIAPAGATNQVVIYAADSSTAMVVADTNLDAIFNLADPFATTEYIWF